MFESDSGVRVGLIHLPLKNLAFVVTAVDLEMCVVMNTVKIDHNNTYKHLTCFLKIGCDA